MGNLFGWINTSCACELVFIHRSRQNRVVFQLHVRLARRVDQDVSVQVGVVGGQGYDGRMDDGRLVSDLSNSLTNFGKGVLGRSVPGFNGWMRDSLVNMRYD